MARRFFAISLAIAALLGGTGSASAESGEAIRKVTGNPHILVKARDLRLTETGVQKLSHIAAKYFKATGKKLIVTGGTRTPERQAELMREKLQHGEDIFKLYENQRAAGEIRDAWREATSRRGATRKIIVKAMRDVIVAQMQKGTFISRHLQSGAIDVRSRGLSPVQSAAFRSAVAAEPGVALLDERGGAEPHFHLSL